MIYGKSTKESIKLLKKKRDALVAFEKRVVAGEQQATLNRLHNIAMDRFDNHPESNVNCGCDGSNSKAYSAFPNDHDGVLLCCIDCSSVYLHHQGEMEKIG